MLDQLTLTQGLAALIGLYFVSAGLGLLRDRSGVAAMLDALKTQPLMGYLSGLIAFVIGGAMVALHNDWSSLLAGFVSLVGWCALIEGVLMLAFREQFFAVFDDWMTRDGFIKGAAIATLIVGAVLLWCGLAAG